MSLSSIDNQRGAACVLQQWNVACPPSTIGSLKETLDVSGIDGKPKKEPGKKKEKAIRYRYSNTADRTRLIGEPGGTPSSIGAFRSLQSFSSFFLLPFSYSI